MSKTIIIIGIFIIATVLVLVIGFIGNKVSDGIANSIRSKNFKKKSQSAPVKQAKSLAQMHNMSVHTQQPNMPEVQPTTPEVRSNAPAPHATAPAPQGFCPQCGCALHADSLFCGSCGARVEPAHKGNAWMSQIGTYAQAAVPKALTDKKPQISALAWVGIVAGGLVVLVIILCLIFGGHDLEGTYRYNGNETLTTFTFYKDGKVTATNDYCPNGSNYGDTLTGKYKKTGKNKYTVYLDKRNGKESMFDNNTEINVIKKNDNTLDIAISGRLSYFESYKEYCKIH